MISEGFHCSGLYLLSLREHARPGVNGLASETQPGLHAARLGFPRNGSRVISPPIFRQLNFATPPVPLSQVMAKSKYYLDSLERRARQKRGPKVVHKLVPKDLFEKFMRPGVDRPDMDAKYGVEKWRHLLLFAIEHNVDESRVPKLRAVEQWRRLTTDNFGRHCFLVRVHV